MPHERTGKAQSARISAPESAIPRAFLPRVGPIFEYFSTGGMGCEFQTPAELLIRSLASDARYSETISLQQRAREEESHNQRLKRAPSATRPRIAPRRSRRVRNLQSPLCPNSASTRDKRESPGSSRRRGPLTPDPVRTGFILVWLPKRNPSRTAARANPC